jgi:hypothetical protein
MCDCVPNHQWSFSSLLESFHLHMLIECRLLTLHTTLQFTTSRPDMPRVPTIALAASIPTAISRRYFNRLAWPAARISSTNARNFPTTTLNSSQKRFHGSKSPGMESLESLSSTPTHPWGDTGSISDIAQRLPAEADMRMPYRFREFEVCALKGRLSVTSWTDPLFS